MLPVWIGEINCGHSLNEFPGQWAQLSPLARMNWPVACFIGLDDFDLGPWVVATNKPNFALVLPINFILMVKLDCVNFINIIYKDIYLLSKFVILWPFKCRLFVLCSFSLFFYLLCLRQLISVRRLGSISD